MWANRDIAKPMTDFTVLVIKLVISVVISGLDDALSALFCFLIGGAASPFASHTASGRYSSNSLPGSHSGE